jgi:hypothetical protein
VPSGNAKPYAYKGNYFVRSGAATVDMPDEVRLSLVLERAHAFDRWELAPSARDLGAIDGAEVTAFRDDAIANNRAPFEAGADVPNVLRGLGLMDDDGEPNRAAIALFAGEGSIGGEYLMLGVTSSLSTARISVRTCSTRQWSSATLRRSARRSTSAASTSPSQCTSKGSKPKSGSRSQNS